MNTAAKIDWSETIAFSKIPGMDRHKINGALRAIGNDAMEALIGHPRGNYGEDCQPATDDAFKAMLETADFGPFRATGIRPAVASLMAVMTDIQKEKPEIHPRIGTAGMLCCRLVRTSKTVVSMHSWGVAIDLTIDGRLDTYGDERVQRGLLEIAPIFQRHGFYWGAAFGREDSMHFEASDQLVRDWGKNGLLGEVAKAQAGHLTIGSRGPEVRDLQRALNWALGIGIEEDGLFGPRTRSAVMAYQARHDMKQTGKASPKLLDMLGLS